VSKKPQVPSRLRSVRVSVRTDRWIASEAEALGMSYSAYVNAVLRLHAVSVEAYLAGDSERPSTIVEGLGS
jgi:hypothetical protein